MAGEQRKLDYVIGSDGVKYKIESIPVAEKSTIRKRQVSLRWPENKLIIFLAVFFLLSSVFAFWLFSRERTPLDKYVSQVDFSLYYPYSLPVGYSVDKNSVKKVGGLVFFTITNDNKEIIISQQKLPEVPPILTAIPEFEQIETSNGKAAVGMNEDKATAVLLTGTTLITLAGNQEVPLDVISSFVRNIVSIPD